MKKKTKKKIIKGSLCVFTGFLLLLVAYYERTINRSPIMIASLEENNNRVYNSLESDELISTLEKETGVVLLVSNRVDASKFIDMLYDFKDSYTIYVYSLKNDEVDLSLGENDEVIVNQKQSKLYEELISYLGVYADDYILVNETDDLINTGYKKVYTPTVLFIKEGKPIYSYSFIEDNVSDEDLIEIYKQGFDVLKNGYSS